MSSQQIDPSKYEETIKFLQQQLMMLTQAFQDKEQKENLLVNEIEELKQKVNLE